MLLIAYLRKAECYYVINCLTEEGRMLFMLLITYLGKQKVIMLLIAYLRKQNVVMLLVAYLRKAECYYVINYLPEEGRMLLCY